MRLGVHMNGIVPDSQSIPTSLAVNCLQGEMILLECSGRSPDRLMSHLRCRARQSRIAGDRQAKARQSLERIAVHLTLDVEQEAA